MKWFLAEKLNTNGKLSVPRKPWKKQCNANDSMLDTFVSCLLGWGLLRSFIILVVFYDGVTVLAGVVREKNSKQSADGSCLVSSHHNSDFSRINETFVYAE